MKSFLVSGLALALFGGTPALAQATRDPDQIQSGTYAVDPGHTQVGWHVSHMGFSNYSGTFSDVSGNLVLDPKNPAASKLSVTVPVASVLTPDPKLNDVLRGDQWLDAGKYPDMTFVSTAVTPAGQDHAMVAGNLTLHGVTKPVTLDVTLVGAGVNPLNKKYTVGFEVGGTFKRSDFGVKTYLPILGDEVHLSIAGAFERQD